MKQVIYTFILLLAFLTYFTTNAQDTGVQFQTGLSWKEIQEKASIENKYIFVDCFATWCAPCKWMDLNIFKDKQVGDYFNNHFICVKAQMDQSKNDSKKTKEWYKDAQMIKDCYGIMVLPTYLFFTPEGKIVHRLTEIEKDPKEFIRKTSEGFDSTKQYYTIINQFEKHTSDSAYLARLIKIALQAGDLKSASSIGEYYIKTLENIYTKPNLQLVSTITTSSEDTGFKIFLNNLRRVDKIMGENYAESFVFNIIYKEEISPLFMIDDSILNWENISSKIERKFPNQSDRIVAYGKIQYFLAKKDWRQFESSTISYMDKYLTKTTADDVNLKAWTVFLVSENKKALKLASEWIKYCLDNEAKYGPFKSNFSAYADTYANLLYKIGDLKNALLWETKALNAAVESEDLKEKERIEKTLNKMKGGSKTWPEMTK